MDAEHSGNDQVDSPLADKFRLTVTALPGVVADAVEISERYWALAEIDETTDPPRACWQEAAAKLSADSGFPASRLYVLAAATVRAVVADHTCPECEQMLSIRARGTY